MRRAALIAVMAITAGVAGPARGATATACTPPPGFQETEPPAIAPVDQLVSHTEEVVIDRPLDVVQKEADQTGLSEGIRKADALPGVSGTYPLTPNFGQPGSRRLVCLTDGSTALEQIIQKDRDGTSARFSYVVWGYTSEKARPVQYAVGSFVRTDLGDGRTRVRWTYSFQLNRQRFPGYLGPIGDCMFRIGFLNRDYAQMMRRTLDGKK